MEITYDNLSQAIAALKKCAQEHEKDFVSTGHIVTADLCNDVAVFLQNLLAKGNR